MVVLPKLETPPADPTMKSHVPPENFSALTIIHSTWLANDFNYSSDAMYQINQSRASLMLRALSI